MNCMEIITIYSQIYDYVQRKQIWHLPDVLRQVVWRLQRYVLLLLRSQVVIIDVCMAK